MTKRKLIGISATDFADSVGVTYEAVMKRVKAGKFSPEAIHEDGSFDEEVARVDWFANTNPNRIHAKPGDRPKPPRKNAAQHGDDAEEKRGEYKIKQDRAEVDLQIALIKLAEMRREYVPVGEAKSALRAVTHTTRDMFLNFSARHGAEIAAEIGADPGTFIGVLEAHIRRALNEAADQPLPTFGADG